MSRRLIFPLLMGLVGVAILIGLGVWQVQRMYWKAGVLAQIAAMIVADPVALPAVQDAVTDRYRPVAVAGRYTGESIEVLSSRARIGPGVRIIAAFETTEGRRILIDRGFLAEDDRGAVRTVTEARVVGNLHWPLDADSYTPPPDPKTGLWFARDVPALAQALRTEPIFIVAREPTGDAITPMPIDTSTIPNDHWGYAITWFLLAAAWAGMTAYLVWRIRRRTV